MKGCLLVLCLGLGLAGCSLFQKSDGTSAGQAHDQPQARTQTELKSQPLKYLVGRHLKPMPDRPLNVSARCHFRDVGGGAGKMQLQVRKASVKKFQASIEIPKHGQCEFDLSTFAQKEKLPNVALAANSNTCVVRMWEQGKGVTIAFNRCQAQCSGDAADYLWPILFNRKTGRCS